MTENDIGKKVVECAFKVHNELGPGLLESSYEECLKYELLEAGFVVEQQKSLPIIYKEVKLDAGYRIDLLVNRKVVIEVRSVDVLNDFYFAQVITYLKLSGCKLGFLINFNVRKIKDGIRRVVNNLNDN